MKMLVSEPELKEKRSRDLIPFECNFCKKTFFMAKNIAQRGLKGTKKINYCSQFCSHTDKRRRENVTCKQCEKPFIKLSNQVKKTKNNFCSQSCAAIWNNGHKTKGCRRSKLEFYLQTELTKIYPSLLIKYNDRTAILSELDIYLPDLKLAFELNGIFHYEPIYGLETLTDIQRRDKQKIIRCAERGIELCIIDSTSLKYFKKEKAKKFLDIIENIIKTRLSTSS